MHSSILVLLVWISSFVPHAYFQEPALPPSGQTKGSQAEPSPGQQSFEVSVPTFPNVSCPIMAKPISSKLYTDTKFGRIYICCKACTKKIQQNPEVAYKAAYPTLEEVENTICPVKGEKVESDRHAVVLQGRRIRLCCDDCIPESQANAQLTLVKATRPKVQDLRNETCPITGEAVAKNVFCLIGDDLVRLSSAKCIDAVEKDPKGALETAKSIVEKQKSRDAGKDAGSKQGPKSGG